MALFKRSKGSKEKAEEEKQEIVPLLSLVVFVLMVIVSILLYVNQRMKGENPVLEKASVPTLQEYYDALLPPLNMPPDTNEKSLGEAALHKEKINFLSLDGQEGTAYISKPEGKGPFPTIVIVHGGQGSDQVARLTAEIVGEELTQQANVLTVTVNWRESKFGREDLNDVRGVLSWLSDIPEATGTPVMLLGMDRGVYLSLLALEQEKEITGLIAAYGYVDPWKQYQYVQGQDENQAKNFVVEAGCAQAPILESCLRSLSLLDTVDIQIPTLILHATHDTAVPIEQSDALSKKIDSKYVTYTPIEDEAIGHDFLLSSSSAGYTEAIQKIVDWVKEQL